jgi:hypothetical protein
VCQTCTCHKHRCPQCQVLFYLVIRLIHHFWITLPIPMTISNIHLTLGKNHLHKVSYTIDIDAKPYQPYGDLNSTYQDHYPGHRPQMR